MILHLHDVKLTRDVPADGEAGLDFLWFVWAFEGFVLFFCTLHLIGEFDDFNWLSVQLSLVLNHVARYSALDGVQRLVLGSA